MERTDKQENMCGGDDRQEFSAACQLCVSRQEVSVLLISDSVECENRCLLLYECELIICVDADDKFVCGHLNVGEQVLALVEAQSCLLIGSNAKRASDPSVFEVSRGIHCHHALSPHPGGTPVLSLRKNTARRPDGV